MPLSSQGAVLGGVTSRDRIPGTEALRAYVEPGESLEVIGIRNQDDLTGSFRCTMSRHYVTRPDTSELGQWAGAVRTVEGTV